MIHSLVWFFLECKWFTSTNVIDSLTCYNPLKTTDKYEILRKYQNE